MAEQQTPSKLGLASVTLKAMLAASTRLCTSPFTGQNGAHTYFKDVMFAMLREQLGSQTLAQDRYLNPSTTDVYLKFAKDKRFTPESVTLASGIQAHWIGNSNARKVILYFHGGGFVIPLLAGHFQFLSDMKDALTDTAVLVPAYELAPENIYPTQLRQCIDALRYLLDAEGRAPSDITIGGDSAGGNLTLGVLSHIAHPHPDIPPLIVPSKLHAAMLLSPWCSFNVHTPSYTTNAEKDMFDVRTLTRWSTAFLGSTSPFAGDFYNEPVLAPASWWEPVADVVSEVLIWGGGNEILLDGIEELARRFQKGYGGQGGVVDTVITPNAAHIEMVLERVLGYKGEKMGGTGTEEAIKGWVKARL